MSLVMSEPVNDTTRRYPRSLAEAFDHERYPAIEHHRAARSLVRPVLLFGAALLAGVGGFIYLIGSFQ